MVGANPETDEMLRVMISNMMGQEEEEEEESLVLFLRYLR